MLNPDSGNALIVVCFWVRKRWRVLVLEQFEVIGGICV